MPERWLNELSKIDQLKPSPDVLERAERGPALPEPAPGSARRTGIALFALLLAVAGSWGVFAILRANNGSQQSAASAPDNFAAVWPETSLADAQQVQARVDAGDPDLQWRIEVGTVALRFAHDVLDWPDPIAGITETDDPDTVRVSLHGPDASCQGVECNGPQPSQTIVDVTMQRLVQPGDGGIWSVTAVEGEANPSPSIGS